MRPFAWLLIAASCSPAVVAAPVSKEPPPLVSIPFAESSASVASNVVPSAVPEPSPEPGPERLRDWTGPIRGRATCAGGVRCPVEAPLCAVGEAGARCVARGTPEHDVVPSNRRFACTRQSDCPPQLGCFFVVGEADFGLANDCSEYPGYKIQAACDVVTDACDPAKADPSCVPCTPFTGLVAKYLPRFGFW